MCQVTAPNPGISNALQAVSAVSANDVWAVGYQTSPVRTSISNYTALTMHFDGVSWQTFDTPKMGDSDVLSAVYSLPGGPTFAVGRSVKGSFATPVLLQYDGKSWSIMPSDLMATSNRGQMNLTGLVALSATDVWAVGYSSQSASLAEQAVALHYDGSSWKMVKVPQVGTSARLTGVAALSGKDLYIVGSTTGKTGRQPLFMRYDGEQWSRIAIDMPGTLSGVVAADGVVYAVGEKLLPSVNKNAQVAMLAVRYNPILDRWTEIDTTKAGTGVHLNSVSYYAGTVFFAGYADEPVSDNGTKARVYSYNGKALAPVFTPSFAGASRLTGIAATQGDVWAVGDTHFAKGPTSTLVLHSLCVR
jgi:hypothetical protein